MADHPTKKQRTQAPYELLYHPGIPGRGEFIRLALEVAGAPYTDVANTDKQHSGYARVQATCMNSDTSAGEGNPPVFAPPALRVPPSSSSSGGDGGGDAEGPDSSASALIISQTPNVLQYLGEQLGLAGSGQERWWVSQLALTALDLNNEVHDTHHPVGSALYYEDQKAEALRKAADVRGARLPKHFGYFERTLKWNEQRGKLKYLVSERLTYADTTVWQVLDGLFFAFPKEMAARKKEFPDLLGGFYEGIKQEPGIKEYLASERRLSYSQGIFRYYPELDRQD